MNMIVAIILVVAVLAVGVMVLPPVKEVTDMIFNTELVSTMDPFLQMFVGFWPIYILLAFVVMAYMLVRRGNQ